MKKTNIWDILSWVALGYILIWLILKVLGVINTPPIIEWSPAFAAVYFVGRTMQKIDNLEYISRKSHKNLRRLEKNFQKLETEHHMMTKNGKCSIS